MALWWGLRPSNDNLTPSPRVWAGLLIGLTGLWAAPSANAQQLALSDDLVGSSRSRALGGASIAGDDGYTAALINPAFIGDGKGSSDSWFAIKQLTFPYLSISADDVSFTDNQEIVVTKPEHLRLEKLAAGPLRKGYLSTSLMPSLVIGRTFVGLIMHYEAMLGSRAPFDPADTSQESLAVRFQHHFGPVAGFAAELGPVRAGVTAAYLERTEAEGDFSYDQLDTPKARADAFRPVSRESSGLYTIGGLHYTAYRPWLVAISAVVHNPGGTAFVGGEEDPPQDIEPKYQLAASMAPKLMDMVQMVTTLQLDHSVGTVSAKELKGSVEWLLGRERNGKKDFAIRLGYNKVGLGYGIKANLGLVAIEYAEDAKSFTDGLTTRGSSLEASTPFAVEQSPIRRRSVSLSINVADF